MRRLLTTAGLFALLSGCGADNQLGGSVGELFPLTISRVEVYRNEQAIQVTYYANRATFLDVVVRIAVSLDGVALKNGMTIQLAGEGEPGHQRTSVAHAPGGEPVRNFPNVKLGDMKIDELGYGEGPDGGLATPSKGNFSMLFDSVGGDLGQGRTLTGNFSVTKTIDAGFGLP